METGSVEIVLGLALVLTALGGAIGTGIIVVWQRNGFRHEVDRLGQKWDREREDWERKERGYIERITRLETTVEMLTKLIPRASMSINATEANIAGDVVGHEKTEK